MQFMKQNDFRKHLSLSVKNYNHLFLVKSFENFCEALRRDFLKIHLFFYERLVSVSFSNRSYHLAGSFEDSSIQVWNVYPKINAIDNSIEGMFVVFMTHRHANVKFVL